MFGWQMEPVAEISGATLVRRAGLLYRKRMPLSEVRRVVAVSRDAFTHDEVLVGFFDGAGRELWLSEFDQGFRDVIRTLEHRLTGFAGLGDIGNGRPLVEEMREIWQRQ